MSESSLSIKCYQEDYSPASHKYYKRAHKNSPPGEDTSVARDANVSNVIPLEETLRNANRIKRPGHSIRHPDIRPIALRIAIHTTSFK